MYCEVEVNTARPGKTPIWKPVTENNGEASRWDNVEIAFDEMHDDGRTGFQIVIVETDGRRTTVPALAVPALLVVR